MDRESERRREREEGGREQCEGEDVRVYVRTCVCTYCTCVRAWACVCVCVCMRAHVCIHFKAALPLVYIVEPPVRQQREEGWGGHTSHSTAKATEIMCPHRRILPPRTRARCPGLTPPPSPPHPSSGSCVIAATPTHSRLNVCYVGFMSGWMVDERQKAVDMWRGRSESSRAPRLSTGSSRGLTVSGCIGCIVTIILLLLLLYSSEDDRG